MIPKIKRIIPRDHFKLYIEFDDGEKVIYDVQEDIDTIEDFQLLKTQQGLFQNCSNMVENCKGNIQI